MKILVYSNDGSLNPYEKQEHLSIITTGKLIEIDFHDDDNDFRKQLLCFSEDSSNLNLEEIIKKNISKNNNFEIIADVKFGNNTIMSFNTLKDGVSAYTFNSMVNSLDCDWFLKPRFNLGFLLIPNFH